MDRLYGVIFLSILILLCGCSSKQSKRARQVKESGFLGDYSKLKPAGEGEALLVYDNPGVNWPAYDKILLAPVAYYGGPDSYPEGVTRADLQELVNRFYYIIHKNLAEDYQMVRQPSPGTLKLRVALTSVSESSATVDTISTVAPFIVNPLRNAAGSISGASPFVGEASVEAEVTDALSGEVLLARVERRVGARGMRTTTKRWTDVEDILWYWGETIRYRLCKLRGDENCIRPEK
jgi:hypothetical protein